VTKATEAKRAKRAMAAKLGLCSRCATRRARSGLQTCAECSRASADRNLRVRSAAVEQGLCCICARVPARSGLRTCADCSATSAQYVAETRAIAAGYPALSVRAAWAWAIVHAGKRIENRTWRTAYRGPLWIHASSSVTAEDVRQIARWTSREVPLDAPRGALVAICDLVDIVPFADVSRERWAEGPWCWILRNVHETKPMVMPGRQRLWTPRSRSG